MGRIYTPPAGTFDLPFTWVYDASQLTGGLAYANQYVYLKGGYGDFILRRIVGLSRLVPSSTYQVRDRNLATIEEQPVYGGTADDIGILPELTYPELGALRFDLGAVTIPTPAQSAQIAFQGVRRMKGNPPRNPAYAATPKSFTHIMGPAFMQSPVGSIVTLRKQMDNYDFELHNIILVAFSAGSLPVVNSGGGIVYTNLTSGSINLTITIAGGPIVVSVAGSNITISGTLGTVSNLLSALQSAPALNGVLGFALAPGTLTPATTAAAAIGITAIASGAWGASGGLTNIWLYDSNRVQVSNLPVYDAFMDGNPSQVGGLYHNGAVVTPLWYPKDSQIQVDLYSNLSAGNATVYLYMVGKKFYPC